MKQFELLIKNAHAVVNKDAHLSPQQRSSGLHITQVDVGCRDGKIVEIGSLQTASADQVLDAKGLHLLPGVIDSQVHFREPGLTHKEDLESGTRSALFGGVTSIFEMPNTNPSTSTEELFRQKLNLAQGRAWSNYAFFIGATVDNATLLGQLENLPACSGVKVFVGSSTGSLLVEDDNGIDRILEHTKRRVIFHSEDEFILKQNKPLAVASKDVKIHHIWRSAESAYSSTKRILEIANRRNRNVHILHVTTAEEMQLLRQYKHIATVEVLPQHLTLFAPECYERLGTLAQQNPPIREKHHQDALWKALLDGTVDVLGSDHAPHTLDEKAKEYPNSPSGMPGVQTLLPLMLNFIQQKKIDLPRLIELVGENPRWVFGCYQKGRIQTGLDADFTLVDLKKEWTISNQWIQSKCGWTPFDGMKITGAVHSAIIGGKVAIQENQLLTNPIGKPVLFT